jgi:undecaprenyl-diphosphatase
MNFLDSVILGVVEGITEFLPISSTAHLIIASRVFGIPETEFLKSFEIAIQLGAILAVLTLYYRSLFDWGVIKRIIAAFVPTAIIGLIFYNVAKSMLGNITIVLWALFLGGIFMLIFERIYKRAIDQGHAGREVMTTGDAVAIGFFQALAIIPGTSRSAATILGGLALGLSRTTITEFSFLLALPTMAAATALDLYKNYDVILERGNLSLLVVGFVVAYIVALIAIKWLLSYVRRNDFSAFAFYRIAIAFAGFLFLI